ncbi:hypothetical protein [Thermogemmatispora tikiterensis]|uniref:DUF732 domain-containing protein n=1 Tax=Thermogemmatispora tikiterensis TaxID=1825093 RepID=A0A328VGA1_9CHLR|nr:hypothetical protein [Thermogemmatispora tikiterensis]RAQ94264.1 hypothetical protein A4R35_01890 [Thermogemmatispora tikiterensis]
MKLIFLLQKKALIMLLSGVFLVGSATAAFAATSTGQAVIQSFIHTHAAATSEATHHASTQAEGSPSHGPGSCPGLPDAQKLAASYHLSTASTDAPVKALCALHQGTFVGTTTGGVSVSASRVYGYGEIDQLLSLAQYLAAHDRTNPVGKLSDSNVSHYLADALELCGTTPLQVCLQRSTSGGSPGNKPTMTPTPTGNKPSTTPTPNSKKPTSTPTPHH